MPAAIGLDTSNYTTSVARFDGTQGVNISRLLDVAEGSLGLRQSDALFQHVKQLPVLTARMMEQCADEGFVAVAASTAPREVEGSYMPCFLAGESQGRALAHVLRLPFFAVSHQQGHLAAAAWSAGRMDLLDTPHLAWHLSGGTTELLYVEPQGDLVTARQIGATKDLSAGQLIDRTGKRLGFAFPAGRAVDAAAQQSKKDDYFAVKLEGANFSLSGLENKMNAMAQEGCDAAGICRFVLLSIASAVERASTAAALQHPQLPILCAGGVASSLLLRARMQSKHKALFADAQYSTDNAMGVAILAQRLWERTVPHG